MESRVTPLFVPHTSRCAQNGRTLIHLAAARGHVDIVRDLLQFTSSVSTWNRVFRSSRFDAAAVDKVRLKDCFSMPFMLIPVSSMAAERPNCTTLCCQTSGCGAVPHSRSQTRPSCPRKGDSAASLLISDCAFCIADLSKCCGHGHLGKGSTLRSRNNYGVQDRSDVVLREGAYLKQCLPFLH